MNLTDDQKKIIQEEAKICATYPLKSDIKNFDHKELGIPNNLADAAKKYFIRARNREISIVQAGGGWSDF